MKIVSVAAAAERLGISPIRVRQLIHERRIRATKVGREWAISEAALRRAEDTPRIWGRPAARKEQNDETSGSTANAGAVEG